MRRRAPSILFHQAAMRFCRNFIAALLLAAAGPALLRAQAPPASAADPARSPDAPLAVPAAVEKENAPPNPAGEFVLRADVEEVALNVTVLENGRLADGLRKEDFEVLEDGVPQTILGFQRSDLPVSIGLVVDNSGSMARKRPAVNQGALDLIAASNPEDEAFVVNFSDSAFLDQEFTSDPEKLREGLAHLEARGGTALYDAVAASADKLAAEGRRSKQVIVILTDGEDNSSLLTLEQTIRRVQQLSGPVIYSIGLLFGDEDMSRAEARRARRALEQLSNETGGAAYFPKSLEQVSAIAAEVAREIRSQYTISYRSTKPSSDPSFRRVQVLVKGKAGGKYVARTRTGYFPVARQARKTAVAH